MSVWTAYRSLGFSIPKAIIGSSLAFVGCLGIDRLAFADLSQNGRAAYLALISLSFLVTERPLTLYMLGIPAALALRKRLLASGGVSLLVAICLASYIGSNAVDSIKHKRAGRTLASLDEDWASNTAACVHQLACWYFVPRAEGIWHLITKVHDSRGQRWLWITGLALGAYSVSGQLAAYASYYRVFYPVNYSTLLHFSYEQPLYKVNGMKRMMRRRFDRLIFKTVLGEPPAHEYKALNRSNSEIRIVKLHAGNRWSVIKANLISVSIFDAPPFEAVSYRWSSENPITILLDGGRFVVSGSVHEMLLALRSRTEDRLLWIDSLCINQADDTEKGWQIGLMRNIYQSAYQVIWWMSLDYAVPFWQGSLAVLKELADAETAGDDWTDSWTSGQQQTKFRSTMSLFCNDVFSRIWIIQEIALARKVIIKLGHEEMPWEVFIGAAESFLDAFAGRGWFVSRASEIVNDRMARALRNINLIKDLRASIHSQGGLALSELLLRSAIYEVTDPRDRVYGLLGLMLPTAESREHSLLEVDYENATEATVLLNATKFAVVHDSSFHLLELAGIGYTSGNVSRLTGRPSWVPQWGQWHMNLTEVAVSECNKFYRTATYTPAVITAREDETRILEIQGIYVGEIKKLSPIWTHVVLLNTGEYRETQRILYIFDNFLDYIEDACKLALEADNSLYDNERETLVWKTICHDSRRALDDSAPTFEEEGRVIQEIIHNLRQLIQSGRSFADPSDISNLSFAFQRLGYKLYPMTGKRLCISSQGYFGVVPPYAREGDQIWAFSGAPNPFLLRPSEDSSVISNGGAVYELVGACYIHAIMNGELEQMGLQPVVVNLI